MSDCKTYIDYLAELDGKEGGGGEPQFVGLDELLEGEQKLSPDWEDVYSKVSFRTL